MISKFKEKSIQKVYNKLIDKNVYKSSNNQKITNIAILLDNETLINVIKANLVNKLPFKKEQITVFTYKQTVKKEEKSNSVFSDGDFGFKASLKSDNLKDFVKKDFDLLINYTKSSNLYTNMVTLLSQSKLKAGFTEIDDRLFDIVVSDNTFNEAVLNQELKKYLTILNKI